MRFENLFENDRMISNFYLKIYIVNIILAEKKNVFYLNNDFRDLCYRNCIFKSI